MKNDEFMAAVLLDHYMLSHHMNHADAAKRIGKALKNMAAIGYEADIVREARDEPTIDLAIAELNKITCTATYATVAKKSVPKGKTGYICKVEMACDDYTLVQWRLLVNSLVVEIESVSGGKWEDILLPSATTETFPDLQIQGGKYIEVQAKDDGSGTAAWAAITGAIR